MQIVVIAHNIRSVHNIGAIFRTCEGFGVNHLYITGYSPYPAIINDTRPPFVVEKLIKQLHKTALGAETMVPFTYREDPLAIIAILKQNSFSVVGLEQTPAAQPLPHFRPPQRVALVLGEEVAGIPLSLQAACDSFVEIPMKGQKESFNVSVATGIALYALTATKNE